MSFWLSHWENAMPDDARKTDRDRQFNSLEQDSEMRRWTKSLDCSEAELLQAVQVEGFLVNAISMTIDADLNIAKIPYESGAIRFRYARVMAPDRLRWTRHGLFVEYMRTAQWCPKAVR